MDEHVSSEPTRKFSPFGLFLVLLGLGLVLIRLGVMHLSAADIWWATIGILGLTLLGTAVFSGRRAGAFWGSVLLFLSTAVFLRRNDLFEPMPWDWPATIALVLALSFLVLYLFDPRRIGVLIPVVIFGGLGTLYYLWWWDVMDWYEVRYYIRTYWPVLLILWGLGVLIGPARRARARG